MPVLRTSLELSRCRAVSWNDRSVNEDWRFIVTLSNRRFFARKYTLIFQLSPHRHELVLMLGKGVFPPSLTIFINEMRHHYTQQSACVGAKRDAAYHGAPPANVVVALRPSGASCILLGKPLPLFAHTDVAIMGVGETSKVTWHTTLPRVINVSGYRHVRVPDS